MKTNRFAAVLTVAALAASALVFSSCEQAASSAASNLGGTATVYFDAHGGGYVGEATVTTNANGAVTSAVMNEWQGPSGWSATADGTIIRFKMDGKNTTALDVNARGYAYFYYNSTLKGWTELTLQTSTTSAYSAPTSSPNFDALMSKPAYAKAYVTAAKAVADNPASTDLANVTVSFVAAGVTSVVTVGAPAESHYAADGASAADQAKALNKADTASQYMPMKDGFAGPTAGTNPFYAATLAAKKTRTLGYHENVKALLVFFKSNPKMDFSTLVQGSYEMPGYTTDYSTTDTVNTGFFLSNNYVAGTTTNVWGLDKDSDGTIDVSTGATYSDFPSYASKLQDAYLMATAEGAAGNLRSVE